MNYKIKRFHAEAPKRQHPEIPWVRQPRLTTEARILLFCLLAAITVVLVLYWNETRNESRSEFDRVSDQETQAQAFDQSSSMNEPGLSTTTTVNVSITEQEAFELSVISALDDDVLVRNVCIEVDLYGWDSVLTSYEEGYRSGDNSLYFDRTFVANALRGQCA